MRQTMSPLNREWGRTDCPCPPCLMTVHRTMNPLNREWGRTDCPCPPCPPRLSSLSLPPTPIAPNCPNGTLYTVQAGDTLRRIAQRFDVTLIELLAANPGQTNARLVIGQQLCIRAATASQSAMR